MSINFTLVGQMVTFVLLVWFTMKYVWPPLFDVLEVRKKKISEGLEAAKQGHESMGLAEQKAKKVLKDAKLQSVDIINLAQKRANEIVEESKTTAKKEGERLLASAHAGIEQELQQVKENLRLQVSALALQAAEQILQAEVDKTKHKAVITKVTAQLGGS